MAAAPRYLTLTDEHFLGPLGLPEPDGALPRRRRELFAALVELLDERGLVADLPEGPEGQPLGEVNLHVPGTPVHVHLSAVGDAQLNEIAGIATGLGLLHQGGEYVITATGLKTLCRLFNRLRTAYGERSVVEALRTAKPPTPDGVTGLLHGAECRHPTAGCRYDTDGYCTITSSVVTDTLADLAARGVVTRHNASPPFEYNVTF